MTATASWTCVDCAVTATYTSSSTATPRSWIHGTRGWLCLNCQREEVIASVPTTPDDESRKARRRALIEFELRRDPEASDGQVARRAHTSTSTVRPVRAELRAEGELSG